jgi:hypothetical protein
MSLSTPGVWQDMTIERNETLPPAPTGDRLGTRTWVTIGGAGAAVVALGVGIGFRLRANSQHDNTESLLRQLGDASCEKPTGTTGTICGQLRSTWAFYDTAVNVSTGAFVAAGILGAATAVTYVLWPKKQASTRGTNVRFAVSPFTRAQCTALVGRF